MLTKTPCARHSFLAILLTCLVHCLSALGEIPLSLEEKIGQLFILPACPLGGEDHQTDLYRLITEYHIGGILLKQGTARGQLMLIEQLQSVSQIPLLCVQDGEWGISMRLVDAMSFPKNLTLGAVQDYALFPQLGSEIGRQCRLVGSHLNLAPVVDVNSNPNNPIIHMRSFGEDFNDVARKGTLIMQGIQSMGVMACAKHFPGHGDTSIDSHEALPAVLHDQNRLYTNEFYPFQCLIDAQVQAVMSAHLNLPAFAESIALPATFSHEIITEILQNRFGFEGLIITDALNMKALSCHYSPEEIAVKAFLAGHDLLLYGDHIAPNIDQILKEDVPRAFHAIKNAVLSGEISEELLDYHVRKVLRAKEKLGLFQKECSIKESLNIDEINSQEALALKRNLFREAVTVVRNEGILPLDDAKTVLIEWGEAPWFREALQRWKKVESVPLEDPDLYAKLSGAGQIIVSLTDIQSNLAEYGLDEKVQELLAALSSEPIPTVAVLFGTPYCLRKMPFFEGLVVAYENEKEAQEAAAEVVAGRICPRGRLPVSVHPHFPRGTGLTWVQLP